MQRRIMVAFFAGVLFCALALGVGIGVFHALNDGVQAQGSATWQVQYFSESDYPLGVNVEHIQEWVNTLPAECNLVTSNQPDLFYYSCPGS